MHRDLLQEIETPFVDAQTLLCLLSGYRQPRVWISKQVKSGRLVRLKNGLYYISERDYILPHAANRLYGPSYVSLQWALSHYGLIPERAVTVTSITTRRNKSYSTPLGAFTYHHLNPERYALAINKVEHEAGRYLIATPEKAFVDFVFFFCKEATLEELIEVYRFTKEDLKNLDRLLLHEIAKYFRSPLIDQLLRSLLCL